MKQSDIKQRIYAGFSISQLRDKIRLQEKAKAKKDTTTASTLIAVHMTQKTCRC